MADTKISELPVATAIASPDVAPIVQGGVTKQADVSLFVGSSSVFLSANTARVDPSGNDGTGTVGDLTKPFLTVQAAIEACEDLSMTQSVIDIGANNFTEDVVITSLPAVTFIGTGYPTSVSTACQSLTFNGTTLLIEAQNCLIGDIIANATDALDVRLENKGDSNSITNTGGQITVSSVSGSGILGGVVSCPGFPITLYNFNNNTQEEIDIDSPGSDVTATRTRLKKITHAANVTLINSRVVGSIIATGTITYQDNALLIDSASGETWWGDQANANGVAYASGGFQGNSGLDQFDFTALPTSPPSGTGPWIDTTGGFNIVKVKLV